MREKKVYLLPRHPTKLVLLLSVPSSLSQNDLPEDLPLLLWAGCVDHKCKSCILSKLRFPPVPSKVYLVGSLRVCGGSYSSRFPFACRLDADA